MKQSLYLETSVIGAYLDNGEPFRRDLTIRWWEHEMPDYRTVISPLVNRELERVSEPHRSAYLNLISTLEQVELTEEAAIGGGYISRGIFHRKYIADAGGGDRSCQRSIPGDLDLGAGECSQTSALGSQDGAGFLCSDDRYA